METPLLSNEPIKYTGLAVKSILVVFLFTLALIGALSNDTVFANEEKETAVGDIIGVGQMPSDDALVFIKDTMKDTPDDKFWNKFKAKYLADDKYENGWFDKKFAHRPNYPSGHCPTTYYAQPWYMQTGGTCTLMKCAKTRGETECTHPEKWSKNQDMTCNCLQGSYPDEKGACQKCQPVVTEEDSECVVYSGNWKWLDWYRGYKPDERPSKVKQGAKYIHTGDVVEKTPLQSLMIALYDIDKDYIYDNCATPMYCDRQALKCKFPEVNVFKSKIEKALLDRQEAFDNIMKEYNQRLEKLQQKGRRDAVNAN